MAITNHEDSGPCYWGMPQGKPCAKETHTKWGKFWVCDEHGREVLHSKGIDWDWANQP